MLQGDCWDVIVDGRALSLTYNCSIASKQPSDGHCEASKAYIYTCNKHTTTEQTQTQMETSSNTKTSEQVSEKEERRQMILLMPAKRCAKKCVRANAFIGALCHKSMKRKDPNC